MRWALLLVFSQACAVGYSTFRPEPLERPPAPDWSARAFVVDGDESFLVRHLLRSRYGVVATEGAPFRVAVSTGMLRPSWNAVWFGISFLSFSLVPGYWTEDRDVKLVVTAPDGATFTSSTTLSRRNVSWLPLALLGANFSASLGAGEDETDLDRFAAKEEVLLQLLQEAEPFVQGHWR